MIYNKYPYTDMHEMNLDFILETVNKMLDEWKATDIKFHGYEEAWTEMKRWISAYFDNLDVQEEINNKLNVFAQDGTLSNLIAPFIESQAAPVMVDSVAEMIDNTKIYVLTTDGYVYTFKNGAWTSSGIQYGQIAQVSELIENGKIHNIEIGYLAQNEGMRRFALQRGTYSVKAGSKVVPVDNDIRAYGGRFFERAELPIGTIIQSKNRGEILSRIIYLKDGYDSSHTSFTPAPTVTDGDYDQIAIDFRMADNTELDLNTKDLIVIYPDESLNSRIDDITLYTMGGTASRTFVKGSINKDTGAEVSSLEHYRTKDFIIAGRGVHVTGQGDTVTHIARYDKDLNFITASKTSYYVPSGIEYVKVVLKTTDYDILNNTVITIDGYSTGSESMEYFTPAFLKSMCIIGDSYASGRVYPNGAGSGVDNYYGSWPQIVARKLGMTVYNSTMHGLSMANAEHSPGTWFAQAEHGKPYVDTLDPQPLYIITMGGNDLESQNLGTPDDLTVDVPPATFYGMYRKSIEWLKQKSPNGLIIITSTSSEGIIDKPNINSAIETIADFYELPYIRWTEDEFMRSELHKTIMVEEHHPDAYNYGGMADAFIRLFDGCVRKYPKYFQNFNPLLFN